MRIGVGNSSHGAIPAMENAMDQRRHAEKEADDAGRSVPCLIGVIRTSIVADGRFKPPSSEIPST